MIQNRIGQLNIFSLLYLLHFLSLQHSSNYSSYLGSSSNVFRFHDDSRFLDLKNSVMDRSKASETM